MIDGKQVLSKSRSVFVSSGFDTGVLVDSNPCVASFGDATLDGIYLSKVKMDLDQYTVETDTLIQVTQDDHGQIIPAMVASLSRPLFLRLLRWGPWGHERLVSAFREGLEESGVKRRNGVSWSKYKGSDVYLNVRIEELQYLNGDGVLGEIDPVTIRNMKPRTRAAIAAYLGCSAIIDQVLAERQDDSGYGPPF